MIPYAHGYLALCQYLRTSWLPMTSSMECIEFSCSQGALFLSLATSWQGDFSESRVRFKCSSKMYSGFTYSKKKKKYLVFLVHGINHRISPNQQNNLNQCFTVWLSITIPTPRWWFPSSLLLDQMVHVLASLLSFADHCTLSKDHCRKPPTLWAAAALPRLVNIAMVQAAFLNLSPLPRSLTS